MIDLATLRHHINKLRHFSGCELHIPGRSISIRSWLSEIDATLDGSQEELDAMCAHDWPISLEECLMAASEDTNIPVEEAMSKRRTRRAMELTRTFIILARTLTESSHSDIVARLGRTDPSTSVHHWNYAHAHGIDVVGITTRGRETIYRLRGMKAATTAASKTGDCHDAGTERDGHRAGQTAS